jgi:hypothetical protein
MIQRHARPSGARRAVALPAHRRPGSDATWLANRRHRLDIGVLILDAVGTEMTPACMYPYADQPRRWRAGDPARNVSGLGPAKKGDFWFHNMPSWLVPRVKASMVADVVVFLPGRDEHRAVHRVQSVAPDAHHAGRTGQGESAAASEDLLETRHVLGLNCRIALNPSWRAHSE